MVSQNSKIKCLTWFGTTSLAEPPLFPRLEGVNIVDLDPEYVYGQIDIYLIDPEYSQGSGQKKEFKKKGCQENEIHYVQQIIKNVTKSNNLHLNKNKQPWN